MQIKAIIDESYKQWIDTPMPGLDGMTPRNASKTTEGRKMLENVFDRIRMLDSTPAPKGMMKPPAFPIEEIRKELGL